MAEIEAVELLRRQYLQLIDPERLILPAPRLLRLANIQERIYDCMFDDLKLANGPPERYRFRVLKRLVNAIEASIEDPDEDEISNDLSAALAQYMTQPLPPSSTIAQQKAHVTYTAPSPQPTAPQIILLEAPSLLASSGTTGYRTWEAALHLGSFFCSEQGAQYVKDKNILELGAGTGFLSILCEKVCGAKFVLATDGSQEVVEDCRANVALNGIDGEYGGVEAKVLCWGHALIGGPVDWRGKGKVLDLVVGADVTYDLGSLPALVATIRDLFEIYPEIKVLISATVRNRETLDCFLRACDTNGFDVKALKMPQSRFEAQLGFFVTTSTPIEILEIRHTGDIKDPFALQ